MRGKRFARGARRGVTVAVLAMVAGAVFGPGASAIRNGETEPPEPRPTTRPTPTKPPPTQTPAPTAAPTTCPQSAPMPASEAVTDDQMLVSVADAGSGALWTMRAGGQLYQKIASPVGTEVWGGGVSWDDSGNIMAWTEKQGDKSVIKVSRRGGALAKAINVGNVSAYNPQLSGTGTEILFVRSDTPKSSVWMGYVCGDDTVVNIRQISPSDGYWYYSAVFSPGGGSRIAMVSDRGNPGVSNVWVYNRGTGAFTKVSFQQDGRSPTFSPDGNSIAFVAGFGNGSPASIGVTSANGGGSTTWVATSAPAESVLSPRYSRSGGQLSFLNASSPGSTGLELWVVNLTDLSKKMVRSDVFNVAWR